MTCEYARVVAEQQQAERIAKWAGRYCISVFIVFHIVLAVAAVIGVARLLERM